MAFEKTFNLSQDVTASDTVDLERFRTNQQLTDGIYVGTAGDVAVVGPSNVAVIYDGVSAGTTLYVQARRINSTGTVASDILALYQI